MVYSELMANPLDLSVGVEPRPRFANLIATVVSSLKEDAAYENHNQGSTWHFTYGSAEVYIHLSGETPEDTLSIWSPVLNFPVKDEARLLKSLLEKNWMQTLEARFCLWNNQVILQYYRTLDGLTTAEISRAITQVATLADEYDEPLKQEFGLLS
jgi:hypothetical protein